MSKANEKPAEPAREGNQRGCIKCHRLLPISAFMRDVTGNSTAWCDACRDAAVTNWGVQRDQVEIVHALYLLEKFLAKEAESITLARVNMDLESPRELEALRGRIHNHHMLRHSRIQGRVTRLVAEYREAWYLAVGMAVPDPLAMFPQERNAA